MYPKKSDQGWSRSATKQHMPQTGMVLGPPSQPVPCLGSCQANQWMLRWGHHTWKPFTDPMVFHKDRVGSRVSPSPQKAANWMTYVQWPFTMKNPVSAVTLFLWLGRAVYSWHVHCSSLIDTSLPQAAIPSQSKIKCWKILETNQPIIINQGFTGSFGCWWLIPGKLNGHFRNLNWRYLPYIRPM